LNKKLLFLLTALAIFMISCSSGMYNRGQKEMEAGNYRGAIASFKQAIADNPEKAAVWKYLGVAYYKEGLYNDAISSLKQASLLAPKDGMTVLYLGLAYERIGSLDEAVNLYRIYLSEDPNEKFANKIRHRVKYLTDKMVQDEIRGIIAGEKTIDIEKIPENSLAVIGFNPGNLTPRYSPLARGLSELLVIDLSKLGDLKLVERIKLKAIMDELGITQSDYFDQARVPRAGKLLGAKRVISGQLSQPEGDELKLESGVIDVVDGFVEYPDNVEGQLGQFFRLEKELAANILENLGYPLTPELRAELEKLPTDSFLAFLSYCLGLEYVDQGMYALAEAQFDNALKEDPNFALAKQARESVKGLSDYDGQVEPINQLDQMLLSFLSMGEVGAETGASLRELQNVLGFQPEAGQDEGDNPYTQPVVGSGSVTVIGSFDE
jgi:tetratricopeptide (TPR) repeat protein